MKKILLTCCVVSALFMASCSHDSTFVPPAPGATIASMEQPIPGAKNAVYRVTITADSLIKDGVYDVCAIYGLDTGRGGFRMPKGIGAYKIVLKKGPENKFEIGFQEGKDTTFNEYFEVDAASGQSNVPGEGMRWTITMNYLKAYTYE